MSAQQNRLIKYIGAGATLVGLTVAGLRFANACAVREARQDAKAAQVDRQEVRLDSLDYCVHDLNADVKWIKAGLRQQWRRQGIPAPPDGE